jgi:hypothetical protein
MRSSSGRRSAVVAIVVLVAVIAGGVIATRRTSANEPHAATAHAAAPASAQTGAGATQTASAVPKNALALTVGSATTGRPIASGFLGLSLEYTAIEPYAGTDPSAPNPVFEQLIRNLSPGQSPVLRIGGDSTDWAWWPVPGATKPRGVRVTLDQRWVRVTAALAHALGARLILGIDLEMDNAADAGAEANALVNGIGASSIEGLELGNEPELYGSFTWYVTPAGVHEKGRPAGYDFSDYLGDFTRVGEDLPRDVPLAGPASGAPHWMPELDSFLSAEPRVRVATLHRYPVQQCFISPRSPQYPTVANLLAARASKGLADSIAPEVGTARSHHVPLRIDEINTVSCGGAPGVANAFVSALWALDTTFEMARVGVAGVNFHTYPGAPYQLFTFKRVHGKWRGAVTPEYYGLLMFAQAAPAGSSLLRTSGTLGNVRAWATRAPGGQVHVLLINDYTAQSRTVAVGVARAQGTATLERLRAAGLHSTTGVTLGGQSFGTSTATGTLAGRSTVTTVTKAGNAYVVKLPPASAALLTFTPTPAL